MLTIKTTQIKLKETMPLSFVTMCTKFNTNVAAVKSKIKSFRSYFSKERQKNKFKKSTSATEENYSSQWFAYKSLYFLFLTTTPSETNNSEESVTTTSVSNNESVKFIKCITVLWIQ